MPLQEEFTDTDKALNDRYADEINTFSWTNASDTEDPIHHYTVPNPFSFNFTLHPARCQGFCPVYQAEYGPFTGENGTVRLDLSSKAEPGRYILQCYYFDAPSDTQVVFGFSQNFTIASKPSTKPIKPFEEYNSSERNKMDSSSWLFTTVVVFFTVLAAL